MVRCMIQATTLMICCMRPMWYRMAKKAETKMMVGRTAKARVASGSPGVPMRPKTSEEPSAEWPSSDGDDGGDGVRGCVWPVST